MKRHIISCLCGLCLSLALGSCGSEDTPEVNYRNPSDFFQPAADDQSDEAQLRRQFFSETGCYLLFTDTIQHDYLGVDINGDPVYNIELLELNYSVGMTAYISTTYVYTYVTDIEQKRQVTEFLKEYVMPHLSKQVKPYSWFISKTITGRQKNAGFTLTPYAVTNQRCTAIAANYLLQRERTDAQKVAYAQRILNAVAAQIASDHGEAFTDFYEVSSDYYQNPYTLYGYSDVYHLTVAEGYNFGFLNTVSSATAFPNMASDLTSYLTEAVSTTEAQQQTKYANYPLVLQKLQIVRDVMSALGYIF